MARMLGPGHTIVTILCDGGHRHMSKFHSPKYLSDLGLEPVERGRGLDWIGPADVDNRTNYGSVNRALA